MLLGMCTKLPALYATPEAEFARTIRQLSDLPIPRSPQRYNPATDETDMTSRQRNNPCRRGAKNQSVASVSGVWPDIRERNCRGSFDAGTLGQLMSVPLLWWIIFARLQFV